MKRMELFLAAGLGLFLAYAWCVDPAFLSWDAQKELATHAWELALISVPMALIVLSGGIDLSVGSIVALSAVVFGLLFEQGAPIGTCAAAALLTGALCGLLNGWFVTRARVHPLIVTLATMAAFRGIAEGISLARPISGFPPSFTAFGGCGPGIFALVFALSWLLLVRTPLGRFVRATGYEERAAFLSGIRVDRLKMGLYALSGVIAAIAALVLVARRNTAKADLGAGLELEAITAVVLGGVVIEGGKGSLVGVLLGVVVIHEIREFISWHWQRDELAPIILGALLILAVLATGARRRGRESPVS